MFTYVSNENHAACVYRFGLLLRLSSENEMQKMRTENFTRMKNQGKYKLTTSKSEENSVHNQKFLSNREQSRKDNVKCRNGVSRKVRSEIFYHLKESSMHS